MFWVLVWVLPIWLHSRLTQFGEAMPLPGQFQVQIRCSRLVGWSVGWVGRLVACLLGWLVGWLGCSVGWLVGWLLSLLSSFLSALSSLIPSVLPSEDLWMTKLFLFLQPIDPGPLCCDSPKWTLTEWITRRLFNFGEAQCHSQEKI